jgi:hypothetical protein
MRILVVANETVESPLLHLAPEDVPGVRVLVVAPALNTRLRHWLSDEDTARRAAARRLERAIDRLRAEGVEADGWIGDADPIQAIDDALHLAEIDRIVIADEQERTNWLARDLVDRARERFGKPVLLAA